VARLGHHSETRPETLRLLVEIKRRRALCVAAEVRLEEYLQHTKVSETA
jgi:hypothetical protein